MTGGLMAFIEARLAEDEQIANTAILSMSDSGEWTAHRGAGLATVKERGYYIVASEMADETAAHIARHDPARVLREVAAKRALLRRHEIACDAAEVAAGTVLEGAAKLRRSAFKDALRALALVWSDHPDYLSEWAPENVVPAT